MQLHQGECGGGWGGGDGGGGGGGVYTFSVKTMTFTMPVILTRVGNDGDVMSLTFNAASLLSSREESDYFAWNIRCFFCSSFREDSDYFAWNSHYLSVAFSEKKEIILHGIVVDFSVAFSEKKAIIFHGIVEIFLQHFPHLICR